MIADFILTEKYEIKESVNNGEKSVTLEGLAVPFDTVSRNGRSYSKESLIATHETLVGKPLLFNHDETKVIGHLVSTSVGEKGIYYKADLDPAEESIVRKLKRRDISNVSIGAILSDIRPAKDGSQLGDVKEFVELSVVPVAGFQEASVSVMEKLNKYIKEEVNKKYQNPDGSFKKQKCPDGDTEDAFCGCVNYMMSEKNLPLENAKKLCAYIKNKQSLGDYDIELLTKYEGESMADDETKKQADQTDQTDQKTQEQDGQDLQAKIDQLVATINDLNDRVQKLEASEPQEPQKPAEQPTQQAGEKARKSVIATEGVKEKQIKMSEIVNALKE